MAEVVSVAKVKTAEHATRLNMHADRISEIERTLGSHIAAVYNEFTSYARREDTRLKLREQTKRSDDLTERLDELTEIMSVLVSAVHKLMRLSDEMDSEFGARLSFLEVISE